MVQVVLLLLSIDGVLIIGSFKFFHTHFNILIQHFLLLVVHLN